MATDANNDTATPMENTPQPRHSAILDGSFYQPPPISEKTQQELKESAERWMKDRIEKERADRMSPSIKSSKDSADRSIIDAKTSTSSPQLSNGDPQSPDVDSESNAGNAKRKRD